MSPLLLLQTWKIAIIYHHHICNTTAVEECTFHINDTVNLIVEYVQSNAASSNHGRCRHEEVSRLMELYSLKAYEKMARSVKEGNMEWK